MTAIEPVATSVAFCVYNRPTHTEKVLAALATVKPRHLMIIADGPRQDRPDDPVKCSAVIDLIKSIDWPADIEWNVSPTNLGLRSRLQSGLSWAFNRVEEVIVVEDDCVPHPSFFRFCTELLDRYRNDPRIAVICGSNFQLDADCGPASYFFSRYPLIWGWAGWRRTWQQYDPDLNQWPNLRETSWLIDYLGDPLASAYWRGTFDKVRAGFDTWDFQLTFSCWRANALAVQPAQNLVTNLGFGAESTFTRAEDSILAGLPTREMRFPLVHPKTVERAEDCDDRTEQLAFSAWPRDQLQKFRIARAAATVKKTWRSDPGPERG
jgi:hypothetical protein